ncbi:MAG: DUF177 domain-containing protein [Deltaproteobacteria bacterium]|nr:DUF177 domain-containing protein [Deltaproteobacteria bacterium]
MHRVVLPIESIPPEGKVVPVEYSAAEVDALLLDAELSDVRALGGLGGEANVLPSGRDVFVLGKLRVRLGYQCVRCLEPFERELAADFHVVYAKGAAEEQTGEIELKRQDLDVEVLDGNALNLTAAVEEQLVLAVEAFPVCRDECQGLCPDCGGNRNRGECRCEARPVDPRFAALASLKTRMKDSEH